MSSNEKKPKTQVSAAVVKTDSTNTSNERNATEANVGTISGALEVARRVDEFIQLRVITSDLTNEAIFRIKPGAKLERLKRHYCMKMGLQVDGLRFVFEGHRITDDDTPKSLGMMNEDVIEIYQERHGGM